MRYLRSMLFKLETRNLSFSPVEGPRRLHVCHVKSRSGQYLTISPLTEALDGFMYFAGQRDEPGFRQSFFYHSIKSPEHGIFSIIISIRHTVVIDKSIEYPVQARASTGNRGFIDK